MKLRIGFVSNSSSSSYVIGVGRLIDEELFKSYAESAGIDYEVYTTEELLNGESKRWRSPVRKQGDILYFREEAFDGNEVYIEIDTTKNEKFVAVSEAEDIEEDPDGDTNYDIDPDDMGPRLQAVLDICEDQGVADFQTSYGAGRNG